MIKTFRGLLADGGQVTIRLSTIRGEVGYRIKKFQAIPQNPGGAAVECTVKAFTVEQDAATATVNFDNSELLGVAYVAINSDNVGIYTETVIFDAVEFNQDIFITHADAKGSESCNYYLELEQVKLNLNEAAVATLKDMRGSN